MQLYIDGYKIYAWLQVIMCLSVYDRWACNVIVMCMCVYICVCVTQISQCCSLTIDRTTFILDSFERSTPGMIGCKQFWAVMWPGPIYLVSKWLSDENHVFHYIWLIIGKTAQGIEITSADSCLEIGYWRSNDTKWVPQLYPFPLMRAESGKNAKARIFHFIPSTVFQCTLAMARSAKNCISVHPLLWRDIPSTVFQCTLTTAWYSKHCNPKAGATICMWDTTL